MNQYTESYEKFLKIIFFSFFEVAFGLYFSGGEDFSLFGTSGLFDFSFKLFFSLSFGVSFG